MQATEETLGRHEVRLFPSVSISSGREAELRATASLLAIAKAVSEFGHEYHGAEVVEDTVILHGVARGTLTPSGEDPSSFANNFLLIFKKLADGKYRLWRVAFAPSGEVGAAA